MEKARIQKKVGDHKRLCQSQSCESSYYVEDLQWRDNYNSNKFFYLSFGLSYLVPFWLLPNETLLSQFLSAPWRKTLLVFVGYLGLPSKDDHVNASFVLIESKFN